MEPPIQVEKRLSAGVIILTLYVDPTRGSNSFCMRSQKPGRRVVPPVRMMLLKYSRRSVKHLKIERYAMVGSDSHSRPNSQGWKRGSAQRKRSWPTAMRLPSGSVKILSKDG